MIEVHPGIYVGNQGDYDRNVAQLSDWAVVHACKIPYHKQALGYSTQGAPKDHPEYYVARRGTRLMMNIVDGPNPALFNKQNLIDPALVFLDEMRTQDMNILIHCNLGESRSPSLALLYIGARMHVLPTDTLESAEAVFRKRYPFYAPKQGIRGHIWQHWKQYCAEGKKDQ